MNDDSPKKIIDRDNTRLLQYHITNFRVPFFETDMGNAVYHGNYYHIFELAREDLLRKMGFPYREFINRQIHLTIVESRCKYRKSLQYDDEIEIRTGIVLLKRRNISFSQLIYRQPRESSKSGSQGAGLELCTESQIDMICVRFTGQPTLLPEDFRLAVAALVKT